MTEEEKKCLERKYDIAIATRNFEIELCWKRALFFWGFIALTFAGYAGSISISCDKCNDVNNFYPLLIACFGFICSVVWSLANHGSKYWQENWENVINELEKEIGYLFYRTYENKTHFSVSKLTISLSYLSSFTWLILIFINIDFSQSADVAIGMGTILFIVLTICFTISSDTKPFKESELYKTHTGTINKN
jgi:hypothetical protein